MAWVTQKFEAYGLTVSLESECVVFSGEGYTLKLIPGTQETAHTQAMMLRRAARRLEEIGKTLS